MSRCFPYPPPDYCRNGATYEALIESIKLQKETNKTKTERKKEKKAKKEKKEKKHKERKYNDDGVKSQRNQVDEHDKVLQKSANCTIAQNKRVNTTAELFEKSDLTEEHGPSHQPSNSSDSTQNSNKRKRDDASLLPDISTGHGKPIKIRLLKKHKGSDSSNFVADGRSNTLVSTSKSDRSLVSSIRDNGLPATSGREVNYQTTMDPISRGTKTSDPNRLHFDRIQSTPSSGKPIVHSTRPQQPLSSSFGRQVLPLIHLEHETPSSSVSRIIDEHELCFGSRPQLLAPSRHGMHNPVSNTTSTSAAVKRCNKELTMSMDCEEDQQKVGLTRFEKKRMKKHSKYEKLIGSWLPPVFQAHLPVVDDDEDWLSKSKTLNSSISKGEIETCRQSVASWQPCVRFLADVDMHALPYTVPF